MQIVRLPRFSLLPAAGDAEYYGRRWWLAWGRWALLFGKPRA